MSDEKKEAELLALRLSVDGLSDEINAGSALGIIESELKRQNAINEELAATHSRCERLLDGIAYELRRIADRLSEK